MKNLILLFLILPVLCKAQDTLVIPKIPIDTATNTFNYVNVTQVPNATKSDLYVKAHEWISTTFKSARNVIQMDDKEAGKIIVKGLAERATANNGFFDAGYPYYLHFTLNFTFRDGKYRLSISDFQAETTGQYAFTDEITPDLLKAITKYNKKKYAKVSNDDVGYNSNNSSKKSALKNQQYLMIVDTFATVTIENLKKVMTKATKDDF